MPSLRKITLLIAVLNTLLRLAVAAFTELGIDEAYYYCYALYPGLSYFDHPPLMAILMRLTTLNMHFTSEFFLRLGPILIGTFNIYLIYSTVKIIFNEKNGCYAALIYMASFYASVISGVFIMPDAPLSLFWLLSLRFAILFVTRQHYRYLLLFALSAGFAILSKYQAAFLWAGLLMYILFYNRKWLASPWLYLSILISLLIFSPVIYWNLSNGFASLRYHSGRIDSALEINPLYVLTETGGQLFYNNPFNIALFIITGVLFYRTHKKKSGALTRLLLLMSLPLILTVIIISFFSRTLPHWSSPAYYSLMILTAGTMSSINLQFKGLRIAAQLFFFLIVITGFAQIKYGIIPIGSSEVPEKAGRTDASLDMYGWNDVRDSISALIQNDSCLGIMHSPVHFITGKWFPAGHLDYYVAQPLHISMRVLGSSKDIHQYEHINKMRPGIKPGEDAYYITSSRHYRPPVTDITAAFQLTDPPVRITIYRRTPVYHVFVYRMHHALKTL